MAGDAVNPRQGSSDRQSGHWRRRVFAVPAAKGEIWQLSVGTMPVCARLCRHTAANTPPSAPKLPIIAAVPPVNNSARWWQLQGTRRSSDTDPVSRSGNPAFHTCRRFRPHGAGVRRRRLGLWA